MENNPYVFKSLVNIYEEYLNLIIHRVKGYKVLVLDDETKSIISLIFSHSYILEKEIFLTLNFNDKNIFEDIYNNNNDKKENFDFMNYKIKNLKHLKVIFLLRPTYTNILRLMSELKKPLFSEYYIFFTNTINDIYIEKLAKADEFDVIKNIIEYYIDTYVLHDYLFHLNIDYTSFLYKNDHKFIDKEKKKKELNYFKQYNNNNNINSNNNYSSDGRYEKLTIEEFNKLEGNNNMIYDNNNNNNNINSGNINYSHFNLSIEHINNDNRNNSNITLYMNQIVQRIIDGLFSFLCCIRQVPDVIYNRHSKIYRNEDPITPLLTQWTYQSMLHELIGIENNKINLNCNNKEEEQQQIVMSCNYDDFYNEHLFDNFGDLGQAVKNYVDIYQEETSKKTNLESIDDIQKFIDIYPNYKKLSGNVTKHVNILHKFSDIVQKRQLFYISELEQSIACYHTKNDHFKQVIDTIKNYTYTNYDVLRLSLLYSLKYADEQHINVIKNELAKRNIQKDQILLIDALLLYSSQQTKYNQLFKEQTFLNLAKTTITRTIKGTSNVFTLHKSYLYYLLEDIIKYKINTQLYTTTNLLHTEPTLNKKINSIVVFFIGGATYEEYRDVQHLSKKYNISIVLGSTHMHNSQSFLADVLQLIKK
ncbi:hypothetical protein PFHG_02018 [Plasmodium falciparum HB3]|uniref:Vacuolar protein sorting-associated protein 45 n=1 Tax=Plasmodium falciparum (isolate HB3) TaxID=137071 RepID=A0A0L7K9W7_PLAFX|nr:hypothetical protein PFHG_02018 [Plasmodium falciparum HB3]